ncbi:OmpA family protein [Bacillus mesophilus]|uniref:OmpA family protein n=2 Tax=Bacillus mesophilus TaxID=1808955 RepID=A0A6M0Q3V5_9BACI|nr:OmpA family protein [Bacillus mesophilus]
MSYSDLMSALLLMFALFLMVNILNNQKSMEEKDKVIEELIGVKSKIIQELNTAFSDSDLQMEVDPHTGAIRFSSGVFFDYNSSGISDAGKQHLQEFIPQYINVLLSDQFRDHVSQVIVEGHTDNEGTYIYNLELSQNRSLSVVKEIFSDEFTAFQNKEELRKIITSNGRSFNEPILNENGEINPDKSRRVEFKFRLKDEELIDEIEQMVKTKHE